MRCERCQQLVSLRMDGEHLTARQLAAMERHLGSCPACLAFRERAHGLRAAVRIRPAEPVPDLVERVMAAVAAEAAASGGVPAGREEVSERPAAVTPLRPRPPLLPRLSRSLAPVAAALVVGFVAGSLAVGGPWQRMGTAPIATADVRAGVLRAASRLDSYQATFTVTEKNLDFPAVTERTLILSVAFRSPERFRLEVDDLTDYPGAGWTPTDLTLVVNRSRWSLSAPSACPGGLGRACPRFTTVVRDRAPFSRSTPMPTDVVVPLETLAAGDPALLGEGTVLGREAVQLELPYERARPLFAFTELGGTWRPFFPRDRVVLWLDTATWLPLEWRVYPAPGRERNLWEQRFELPPEPPARPILEVRAVTVSRRPPPRGAFRIAVEDAERGTEGVRRIAPGALEDAVGYQPVAPESVDGLELYEAVVPEPPEPRPEGPAPAVPDAIVTYARGVSWVKVAEDRVARGEELPFGPIGPLMEEVRLPNGGVAYYQPATEEAGRRLLIHGAATDLMLETNLPREELIQVAARIPVVGRPAPPAWFATDPGVLRLPLEEAAARAGFPVLVPSSLPESYGLSSVELDPEGPSLTLFFRPEDSLLAGAPIRLFLQPARALPPSTVAGAQSVEVRDAEGRFVPQRSQLEWVEAGLYVSLDAPGATLEELMGLARTLEPVAAPSPEASPSPGPAEAA
ncbi:MAG TPA: zf-HC2 domain-containing protein [Actinomycetota bacterium]|nr:zf-HC2 domain-containing protein [Actinomycetota bacterium]